MKNKKRNNKSEIKNAYLFIAPMILFAVIFVLLPVAGTFVSGFFRDITFLSKEFIGLENYKKIFGDIHFWHSFRFTVLFVIVSVSIEIVLGLIFAVLLNEKFRFRGLARTAILIPWAIPVAVSARVWQLIYNYDYGVFNYFLLKTGIVNEPVNWLGSAQSAFFSLVISDVWKATPFVAIILLAGLSAIPEDLYNQAMIDGAAFHQRFFKITLPLLKPVIVVSLLFRTIDAIRVFDLIYILTGGGPGGSTTSISLYTYKYFLAGDFGYGSAVSVVIFLIAFALSLAYIKVGKFTELG